MTIGAGTMIGLRNRRNSVVHASWCLSLALSIATSGPVSAISIDALRELLAQDLLGALAQRHRQHAWRGSDVVRPGIRARHRNGQRYPHPQGPIGGRAGIPMALPFARIFTIFEGTSEIQRMLIGRTVTGLDVR